MCVTEHQLELPFEVPPCKITYGERTCPDCGSPIIVLDPRKLLGRRMLAGFGDRLVVNAADYMPHPCFHPLPGERLPRKGAAWARTARLLLF
jgi:hypothetical protein